MSLFTKIKKAYARATPKQFVLTGVFALALAGAIVGGFASKQYSSAAVYYGRDPDAVNSIDNSSNGGGVGALSADEFISDVQNNNPSDLQTIYDNFGLQTNEYTRFKNTWRPGVAYKNGTVVVDNEVVMTDAWSIGRTKFWYSTNYGIGGHTYYKSMDTQVLLSDLPVMVMFDENGVAEFAAMNACGNPVGGNKRTPSAECKSLNKVAIDGKENTYKFNSTVETDQFGLAKVVKLDYYVNDGSGDKLFDTTTNPGDFTKEITLTKASTITVKVTVSLPGKQTKVITDLTLCSKKIGVVQKEVLHVCEALVATSTDNVTFRFTVHTKQSNGVTVKSADFTEAGTTINGVAQKDSDGNIFREYTFNDFDKHTVTASKVTFVVDGKDVGVITPEGDCQASVTRNKTPECKPGIPVGDSRCQELPHTGPAGMAGLFAGVSAAGAAAHRWISSRKRR